MKISIDRFPIGLEMDVSYPSFQVSLKLLGRDALQSLVAGLSRAVFYEPGLIVAEGDLVAIHGRIRGWADVPQVVIDVFRIEDGKLAEHWDVLQIEVAAAAVLGGISMFEPEEEAHRA